jgi:energy-coupling factor transport system substrate-specific component
MVVLVALIAALYAATLIPFKVVIPIMPGITEFRPANVIPVVCSILFGPAAAWGSAFGNLIGDFFGTIGPGSFFGFIGNFLYGYLPYKVWQHMSPMLSRRRAPLRWLGLILLALGIGLVAYEIISWATGVGVVVSQITHWAKGEWEVGARASVGQRIAWCVAWALVGLLGWFLRVFSEYLASALASAAGCALVIGWGLHLIGIAPFAFLANVILLNNFLVAAVLGPPLLAVLYPRVRQWGLLWHDILEPQDRASGRFAILGIALCWLSVIGGLAAGNMISLGLGQKLFAVPGAFGGQVDIGLGVAPAIVLLIVACVLL